jgi:hypothetical protein
MGAQAAFSSLSFPDTVTLQAQTWTTDAAGGRTASAVTVATIAASVQPESLDRTADHRQAQVVERFAMFTAVDPVATYGLKPDDLVLWGPWTLQVRGTVRNEGGLGLLYRTTLEGRR